MVASGRAEFFFELRLSPWDYAAGALLVEEAGGIVSDLEGNPITYDRKQTMTARGPKVRLLDGLCKDAASQVLINEDGGKGSRGETEPVSEGKEKRKRHESSDCH